MADNDNCDVEIKSWNDDEIDYDPKKSEAVEFAKYVKTYGTTGPPSIAKNITADVDPTLFTNHGKGLVDFILAYQPLDMDETQVAYREIFEAKLREQGLFLEHEELAQSQDGKTCFVKIHAPWEVLSRTAEINRVKLPLKQSDLGDPEDEKHQQCGYRCFTCCCCGKHPCELEHPYYVPQTAPYFTLEFQRSRFRQFLIQDPNTFFTQAQRINMVWDIIERVAISGSEVLSRRVGLLPGHGDTDSVTLSFLLPRKVFVAAFPLHDGDTKIEPGKQSRKPISMFPLRPWLYETWARPGRWFKYQPLDQVRAYFGEKVAIYFAWLGFYTKMLIPLTIAGFLCFIYGAMTFLSDDVVYDVCEGPMQNITICRHCGDRVCPFTKLGADCKQAVASTVFNNYGTMIFALFTSLWCVTFLEFWKRYQSRLSARWDTFDVETEYEPPRPEYITLAKNKRRNPVTQEWEPHIPARSRIQNLITSIASVTFLIALVIAVISAVIVYKIVMVVLYSHSDFGPVRTFGSNMFTTITASLINTIAIMVLEQIYGRIAWKLTEKEYPRTDTDFETSYTYKMYIFQFVNYYATLFYLAFIQPNSAGSPKTDTILTDRCPPAGGCTFSVTVQLATVLIVKQIVNNTMELGKPMLMNWWKRRKNVEATADNVYARYEKDFDLTPLPELSLFGEYFEMIMQFGFVTMFVAAFPLAPFFALLNNIIEIRLDAYKFTAESRRALPLRGADIGSWYSILEWVSRLAVLTNALVIAFTTDIIDRLVYVANYSENGTLDGYLDWTLAYFNPRNWTESGLEKFGNETIHLCRYRGYYNPPWAEHHPYGLSSVWWRVMLARAAFVLIFEHVIFFTQSVIQYAVPDIPEDVALHIQRNRFLEKMAAVKTELARSESLRRRSTPSGKEQPPLAPKPTKFSKGDTDSIGPSVSMMESRSDAGSPQPPEPNYVQLPKKKNIFGRIKKLK